MRLRRRYANLQESLRKRKAHHSVQRWIPAVYWSSSRPKAWEIIANQVSFQTPFFAEWLCHTMRPMIYEWMFRFDHKEGSGDDEVQTLVSMPKIPAWKLWHKSMPSSSKNIRDFMRQGPSASCCARDANSRKRRRSGQSDFQDHEFARAWQRSRVFTMQMQLQNCMGCRRAQFAGMSQSRGSCCGTPTTSSSSSSTSSASSGCSPRSSE